MISSPPDPPEEAEHFRGKTLTPESPKPVHYPSPANIPILEKQMDPMFNEPALSIGTPASYQSYPQQTQTPSAHSATSYYGEQQSAPSYQNAAATNALGALQAGYSQSTAYGSGANAQSQDTSSIHTFPSQNQATTSSYSDAKSAPSQDARPAYPSSYDPNAYAAQLSQAQPSQGTQYQNLANTGGDVNYQALLDSLSPTAQNGVSDRYATPSMPSQPSQAQGQTPISEIPAPANLPPRPPAQDRPTAHPNFNPSDDIRSFHPHSQKSAANQFRGSGQLQVNIRGGADGHSARSNPSPSTPGYGHRQSGDFRSETPDDEDIRWPPEINRLYEEFLEEERKYVTDGQWDQFPMGSRLFIGNLPTEKVTKRDIFHRFFRHGKLAQISIKQAYGFVQFLDVASCSKALQAEQGQAVRGRKMHLEISKPQRNTKKTDNSYNDRNSGRRRSRSPDYSRGGTGQQSRHGSNYNAMSPHDRENRRFRDDYRPNRSPSPQRGGRGYRGRDRSRDRYDGRRRSRSRSPRRFRSPSPGRDFGDDLPLPARRPHEVPDIQILVVDAGLPRDYIGWVEDSLRNQGLRADVLIISPRLPEAAVVRRQILEGVLAIVKLNSATLSRGKVNLQVFDRRGGTGNVQFNEYADLDPSTAAALVTNAKQTAAQPVQPPPPPPYGQGYGNYGNPAAPPPSFPPAPSLPNQYPPTPTNNPPNFPNAIPGHTQNSLSQILGALSGNNTSQSPQLPNTPSAQDLARLLSSAPIPAPPQPYTGAAQPPPQGYPNVYQNSALASLLGGQPPAQPMATPPVQSPSQPSPSGQPDMKEIMAQLAKYQR